MDCPKVITWTCVNIDVCFWWWLPAVLFSFSSSVGFISSVEGTIIKSIRDIEYSLSIAIEPVTFKDFSVRNFYKRTANKRDFTTQPLLPFSLQEPSGNSRSESGNRSCLRRPIFVAFSESAVHLPSQLTFDKWLMPDGL